LFYVATRKIMKHQLGLKLTSVLALCALLLLVPAQPAAAAGGTVQVRMFTGSSSQFSYVAVTGYNQNDQYSVWKSWPNRSDMTTGGWWWRHYINVEFQLSNGVRRSCFFSLQTYPWTNTLSIKIDDRGNFESAPAFGVGAGPGSRCADTSRFVL
jgi:hypothetical protein